MGKFVNRRDFLKFLGGGVVGTTLSPLPWKLLDDAAIWTQNWSWLPRLPRGEISVHYTHCTLCPAGCGLRVRCVGDEAFGLSGVRGHPISCGHLCPLGLAGHHLRYHPARLTSPQMRAGKGGPAALSRNEAVTQIAAWLAEARATGGEGAVAVLDARPGRELSLLYRRFLAALGCGAYLVGPSQEASTTVLGEMLTEPYGPLGIDLEGVQTLLSFGAPVLDGWGAPGRIAHLIPGAMTRAPGGVFQSRDHHPLLIQIETRPSRTALRADQWLRIKPGTEAALALSLGHVIVAERLYSEQFIAEKAIDFSADGGPSYRRLISHFTPERTAVITGLPPDMIRETARRFAEDRPAIAIPGVDPGGGSLGYEEELAIWGLNLLVGNLGQKGGFLPRALEPAARQSDRPGGIEGLPLAPCRDVSQVPDRSIHLLIVDGPGSGCALPWAVVERKLAVGARVVNLSPFRAGSALRADLILPAPASMERLEDVPAPFDSPVSSLGLSVPILPAPAGTMEPAELVFRLAGMIGMSSPLAVKASALEGSHLNGILRRRVEAIQWVGRGELFRSATGERVAVRNLLLPGQLWDGLTKGDCWVDQQGVVPPVPRFRFLGNSGEGYRRLLAIGSGRLSPAGGDKAYPLVLMPFGWRAAVGDGPLPPVMAKLYRESDLRAPARCAAINTETGRALGVKDGAEVTVETSSGSLTVKIQFNAAVMPGVIHIAAGPSNDAFGDADPSVGGDVLEICCLDGSHPWRAVRAKVQEA